MNNSEKGKVNELFEQNVIWRQFVVASKTSIIIEGNWITYSKQKSKSMQIYYKKCVTFID